MTENIPVDPEQRLLTVEKLRDLFTKCAVEEDPGERTDNHVEVEGVVHRFIFRKDRLEENRELIKELLGELPDEFHKGSDSGGFSFLAAHQDRHGFHWGEHRSVEVLMAFGLATGLVTLPIPRKFWHVLPGGLPYLIVDVGKEFPKDIDFEQGTIVRALRDLDPSGANVKKGMVGMVRAPSNTHEEGEGPLVAWENSRTCNVCKGDVEVII